MKLEEQVCSLGLAQKLKELGVKQESLFCWYTMRNDVDHQDQGEPFVDFKYCSDSHFDPDGTSYYHHFEIASAFTVAELGEMLPVEITEKAPYINYRFSVFKGSEKWGCAYENFDADKVLHAEKDGLLANVFACMLIWCIENGASPS